MRIPLPLAPPRTVDSLQMWGVGEGGWGGGGAAQGAAATHLRAPSHYRRFPGKEGGSREGVPDPEASSRGESGGAAVALDGTHSTAFFRAQLLIVEVTAIMHRIGSPSPGRDFFLPAGVSTVR